MQNDRDSFMRALKKAVDDYGADLLKDIRRANAILMDYAPHQSRERKLIISALEEGTGRDIEKALNKGSQEQHVCIIHCVRRLVDESWVTEDAARFAVESIAFSLGMQVEGSISARDNRDNVPIIQTAEKELKKGERPSAPVDLKEFLCDYQVIGYKAFAADQTITDIVLPQGIRTIKSKAFASCVNLKRIVLPNSIEEIGGGVFSGCESLETIVLERNANYTVVNGMLIDKKNKVLIRASKGISDRCVIPAEITEIQMMAFEKSNVQTIVLPKNLKELSGKEFVDCNALQGFEIDFRNMYYSCVDGVIHTRDRTTLVRFPAGYQGVNYIIEDTVTQIESSAFSGSVKIETITFTSNLKSIGPKAFENCRRLSSLVLPSSVKIIGERAFQYCDNLSSVMLPRSIQEIGDYAFCGCVSIKTINIPKEVKRIGHSAFKDCSSLTRIIIQNNVEFIGDGAFVGCSRDFEIAIKNNSYVEKYCDAHKIKWSTL